jgi:hypothetical protein
MTQKCTFSLQLVTLYRPTCTPTLYWILKDLLLQALQLFNHNLGVIYLFNTAADTLDPITEKIVYGIPGCFYDAGASKIKCANEGAWQDQDNLFQIDASDDITFMPLAQSNFGLLVLNDGSMSGDLYFFSMGFFQESG